MDDDAPDAAAAGEATPTRQRANLLRAEVEADVSVHVFSVSAALVGVCLTVIGIIRISLSVDTGYATVADEFLAIDAFVFTAASLLAYAALRSPTHRRSKRLETYADRLFIGGMVVMCLACSLVAFSFF